MNKQAAIQRRRVRSAIEARLGRRLLDHEFERLLRLGNGVFWDYERGSIDPYDLTTLESSQGVHNQHAGN